jgi:hypothetical protein
MNSVRFVKLICIEGATSFSFLNVLVVLAELEHYLGDSMDSEEWVAAVQ